MICHIVKWWITLDMIRYFNSITFRLSFCWRNGKHNWNTIRHKNHSNMSHSRWGDSTIPFVRCMSSCMLYDFIVSSNACFSIFSMIFICFRVCFIAFSGSTCFIRFCLSCWSIRLYFAACFCPFVFGRSRTEIGTSSVSLFTWAVFCFASVRCCCSIFYLNSSEWGT